jgi:hypothetical protein
MARELIDQRFTTTGATVNLLRSYFLCNRKIAKGQLI